jgi:DNA-binding MarR family transcriptional regulator
MHLPPRSALEAVYELVTATTHNAEPALADLGLTMSTTHALWAIDPDEPPPAMKVVAQRLRCTASSLTFVTDRLVERGYITRTEDPENRRSRVLSLTTAGQAARQTALDALNQACPLSRLSDDERDNLLNLVGRALADGEGGTDAWTPRVWGERPGSPLPPRKASDAR